MEKKVNIAIIGAGTAGLSAYKEARKYTKNVVIIDNGPLGTTCARVGCMPSKLLIHPANEYYQARYFKQLGIEGAEQLRVNLKKVMQRVRLLRGQFTDGVVDYTRSLGDRLIEGKAEFLTANVLKVGKEEIRADSVIIATGSSSAIPSQWSDFSSKLLTSENIFEQEDLAKRIAVIGGGIIGIELGQALSRLGIKISLFHSSNMLAGLTDPKVNEVAIKIFKEEFSVLLNERVSVDYKNNKFCLTRADHSYEVAQVLLAAGRRPNLAALSFEKLNLECDDKGIPKHDLSTMQICDTPIFIAGDVNKQRPLLHEAADEGRIAAYNAVHLQQGPQCFKRRVPLRVVFSQPNIAVVGSSYRELSNREFLIGEVDFGDQGRARIENHNKGLLRVYGSKVNGKLLGAECIAPDGEHVAHLLAWGIQHNMTVFEMLQMPFYHPVVEEGMRTALRDLAKKIKTPIKNFELAMCDSEAVTSLS